MSSDAKIEANRQNALKSTGPNTPEGKARSRQNALKHGLTGAGVVLPREEAEEVERRAAEWAPSLPTRAKSPYEQWLIRQVVIAAIRLDRCRRLEAAQRSMASDRAHTMWNEDRALAVEWIATRLAKAPGLTVRQLRQTKQGCDWLLARWRNLSVIAQSPAGWDDPQRTLAFNLLGVPESDRTGDLRITPQSSAEQLKSLADQQIDELSSLSAEALEALDADEQDLAENDLLFDISTPAKLLRRYESSAKQLLFWALSQLRKCREHAAEFDEEEDDDEGLDDFDELLDIEPAPKPAIPPDSKPAGPPPSAGAHHPLDPSGMLASMLGVSYLPGVSATPQANRRRPDPRDRRPRR